MTTLELEADVAALTEALVNVASVSHHEAELAGMVDLALRRIPHLQTQRQGNTVVARTSLSRPHRVIVAGHLDTVPVNQNLPSHRDEQFVHGLGSCDMKGGIAVALSIAAALPDPAVDVTYIYDDGEEVEQEFNGLAILARQAPELLTADFAILMEPSGARVEAGCQGSLDVRIRTAGRRAHSARSWTGHNAIHVAAPVLNRLVDYQPRRPMIDGLEFHEGLNAVAIAGGVAMNVIPDECFVSVNHRFAPDRTPAQAQEFVRSYFAGFEIDVLDASPAAPPGLTSPQTASFIKAVGRPVSAKLGWTDVARFAQLGIPAVNFGPADPLLAHTQHERVPIAQLHACRDILFQWLSRGW